MHRLVPHRTQGPYRPEYCALEHHLPLRNDAHEVVVVPSTNEVGREGSFTITVQTNDCPFSITPIPNIGLASSWLLLLIFHMLIRFPPDEGVCLAHFVGVWHPDSPGQQGGPLDNPRLEFKTTAKTLLGAYITTGSQVLRGTLTFGVNVIA